jgi:hypothetical protein
MAARRSTNQPSHEASAGHSRWARWRADRLLAAGFTSGLAQHLAGHEQVDVHALLELVDRGCPPHLAARILAPLDEDPAPPGEDPRTVERG